MRRLLYTLTLSCFSLIYAADSAFVLPRRHLSIYNKNFEAMTRRQLKERKMRVEFDYECTEAEWFEKHKVIRCVGINCCFWGIAIPVATAGEAFAVIKHISHVSSSIVGFTGFAAGAYAADQFNRWYQPPPQMYRQQELQTIDSVLKKKKYKID